MTVSITRQNHYVPIWYQKRFIPEADRSLFYLDLNPSKFALADRRVIVGKSLTPRAPKSCFWSEDLYTTRFGSQLSDEIERRLFGKIDNDGAPAFAAFSSGDMSAMHERFMAFFEYLSTQKLRTPKGLDWIKAQYPHLTQFDLMLEMQSLRRMFCTLWLEGVREVVSAEQSDVKFILTDHPVTAYNSFFPTRSCGVPISQRPFRCLQRDADDLPLGRRPLPDHYECCLRQGPGKSASKGDSGERPLCRTDHLSHGRAHKDPSAKPRSGHIHQLSAQRRARQFLAASEKDWLFPEKQESRPWREVGQVLLPPSNELWHFGGEIVIGHTDGSSQYQDEFGRSQSHEHLKKKPSSRPQPNDLCGCGSGQPYRECCSGVPQSERPPWDVFSIRERNLMFANAVLDILGLNKGKTWKDVRRDLSDEQVKRIHEVLAGNTVLYPTDEKTMNRLIGVLVLIFAVFAARQAGAADCPNHCTEDRIDYFAHIECHGLKG